MAPWRIGRPDTPANSAISDPISTLLGRFSLERPASRTQLGPLGNCLDHWSHPTVFDLTRRIWDSLHRSFERFGALRCRGRAKRLDAQGAGSRLALRYRSWQAGPREPAHRPERLRPCAALGPGLRSGPVAEVCFTALTDGAVHALEARALEAETWPSMHAI